MQHAYKTTDLTRNDLNVVKRLLGRSLQNDEAVEVIARKLTDLSDEVESRRRAAARILQLAKGKSLHGVAVRDLIDEGRRL